MVRQATIPLWEPFAPLKAPHGRRKSVVSRWAESLDGRQGVPFGSSLEAYTALFKSIPLEAGAKVLVSACATGGLWEAMDRLGLEPVVREPDPYTLILDGSTLEPDIWNRVDAVVISHLYGRPAPLQSIVAGARKFGVFIISDARHALGAEYRGRKVGTFGDAAVFCFAKGRVIGAEGGGAAVVTPLADVAKELKGQPGALKSFSPEAEAALHAQLDSLDEILSAREALADAYRRHLGDVEGIRAALPERQGRHVYYRFVIRVPEAEAIQKYLRRKGIETGRPVFPSLERGLKLPICEAADRDVLYLPIIPSLGEKAVERICDVLAGALAAQR